MRGMIRSGRASDDRTASVVNGALAIEQMKIVGGDEPLELFEVDERSFRHLHDKPKFAIENVHVHPTLCSHTTAES